MSTTCTIIKRHRLRSHPANANRMPEFMLRKLVENIRESRGEYPAVIVRAHPVEADAFEILDGHHRVEALGRLEIDDVRCDIWQADDERAALLLTTLNRLQGRDDPAQRGRLLEQLARQRSPDELARLLPEDAGQIRRLIECIKPVGPLRPPPAARDMHEAVTFFLTHAQRDRLLKHLGEIARDRSEALVRLLALNGEVS